MIGLAKGNLVSSETIGEFVPISWADSITRGIPSLPACVDMSACANSAAATTAISSFTVSGGARAPGTGFNTEARTEKASVCYSAPPGFEIIGQVDVIDNGNNGGRGSLGAVQYTTGAAGAAIGACVEAKAWSDAVPFGAGGWQNVTMNGTIRKIGPVPHSDATRRACANIR